LLVKIAALAPRTAAPAVKIVVLVTKIVVHAEKMAVVLAKNLVAHAASIADREMKSAQARTANTNRALHHAQLLPNKLENKSHHDHHVVNSLHAPKIRVRKKWLGHKKRLAQADLWAKDFLKM
jgi:hypothetical protein